MTDAKLDTSQEFRDLLGEGEVGNFLDLLQKSNGTRRALLTGAENAVSQEDCSPVKVENVDKFS